MIGLKRHSVELAKHDPSWAEYALRVCNQIKRTAGHLAVDVQHVGSTAVPGLVAKPIIDVLIGMPSREAIQDLIPAMERLGYIYRGDGKESGGHLFVFEDSPDIRSIHVHAVEYNSDQWCNYLLFRDTLQNNSAAREEYAKVKSELAVKYCDDRKQYTASKSAVIVEILRRASKQGGGPRVLADTGDV